MLQKIKCWFGKHKMETMKINVSRPPYDFDSDDKNKRYGIQLEEHLHCIHCNVVEIVKNPKRYPKSEGFE